MQINKIKNYDISKSLNLEQANNMFNKAFNKDNNLGGLIFHLDQGWQYQFYQQRLKITV